MSSASGQRFDALFEKYPDPKMSLELQIDPSYDRDDSSKNDLIPISSKMSRDLFFVLLTFSRSIWSRRDTRCPGVPTFIRRLQELKKTNILRDGGPKQSHAQGDLAKRDG